MTYPQQYAPQGYAPQQYAQPQQQPYQPAPQQPTYAPQQFAPQGAQTLPTSAPSLGQTKGAGGNVSPKARHLVGRTIIIEPIRVDESAKNDKGDPRPEAYFHLTVCDGGPLEFGDSLDRDPAKQHGPTQRVETPVRFTNINDYGWGFVNECRDALARGDMAAVGVFEQGTQGNRPYLLTKPGRQLDGKDRPDGDQRFATATELWNRIFAKDLSWNPTPVSLVAPPAQAPQQVSYQPTPPQQGATYGTAGGAPQYVTPTPTQYVAYQPAGATMATPTAPVYAPQQQGPYGEAAAYNPMTPLTQAVQQSAPPANPAFEAWLASLPPEQRAAYAAPAPQHGPGI